MSVHPRSINVSWEPPPEGEQNGEITGYVIHYTRVGSNNTMRDVITTGSRTTLALSGLDAFVNYLVEVAARTVNGTGPFSDPMIEESGHEGECKLIHLAKC